VEGQVVPIDAGIKLIGHSGPFSIGALSVETSDTDAAPAENLAVARGAYDVNDNLRVGSLMTHGDPTGLSDNTFVGFDSVWRTSNFQGDKNLTLSGWYAHSYGDLQPGRADGYGAAIEYPNDLWFARRLPVSLEQDAPQQGRKLESVDHRLGELLTDLERYRLGFQRPSRLYHRARS
jgi:hypothetical protein